MTPTSPCRRRILLLIASLPLLLFHGSAQATDAAAATQAGVITTHPGTGLPGLPGMWEIIDDDDDDDFQPTLLMPLPLRDGAAN